MRLPYLTPTESATKKYIVAFRGLNYGEGYGDGELLDSRNMTTEQFPCLAQCPVKAEVGRYSDATTMQAKNGLLVVSGDTVWFNDMFVGNVTPGRKQTAVIGNYIVIFPDKVYYNVAEKKFGSMEEYYEAKSKTLTFTDGEITTTGADWPFRKGDAVEISGCTTAPENNKTVIIREVDGKKLTFYADTLTACEEAGVVTVARKVPDLDFICESNYRLWGTKDNTIYASKYSDPLNFAVFDGLSGDSYYIDVGSDGEFTGCIPYSSHICFFKENTLHKLYGSKPSNFQVVTSQVYGVQAGSERSMCIVNEQLLFKGVNGIYAYTGSVPELVSECFGTARFSDAVAACDGERYYVSMRRGDAWGLYTYDVMRDIWLQEDETHAIDMAVLEGAVYILRDDGRIVKIDREADRRDIEWSATFCPFTETVNERKGYSKFHMRLALSAGAWIAVDVKTDRDQKWNRVYTTHNELEKTVSVPILPTRCDQVTVRIRGKGVCVVKAFIREFTVGSDV